MGSEFDDFQKENQAKRARALQLSYYLEDGFYEIGDDLRVIFKKSQRNSPIVEGLYGKSEKHQSSLGKATPETTLIQIEDDQPKQFAGTIMWFCSDGDLKIFSDTETLTLCANKDNYLRKLKNDDHFSPYFRMPAITKRDDQNNLLIEQFITFENKSDQDDAFILKNIYRDYSNYFSKMIEDDKVHYQTMNELLATSSNTTYRKEFEPIIHAIDRDLFEQKFPYMKLHGDLWTANILLERDRTDHEGLWYIDWDVSGEYLFFYDFFKFMWNELDVNQNYVYYESYLKGEFDSQLKKIFSLFQLEYQPEQKQSYFCLFFLNFILDETGMMDYEVKQLEMADFQQKVVSNMGSL